MSTPETFEIDLAAEHNTPPLAEFAHGHEHHDHPYEPWFEQESAGHHIDLKEGHLCGADCPEHRGAAHNHDKHQTHQPHSHESEHGHHTIQHKQSEHKCSADCPEHAHGSHSPHQGHTAEHSHKHSHAIEHKPHACSADCPEHGSSPVHTHWNEQKEHSHHTHTIEHKAHACGADCPEHGRAHTHDKHIHMMPTDEPYRTREAEAIAILRANEHFKSDMQAKSCVTNSKKQPELSVPIEPELAGENFAKTAETPAPKLPEAPAVTTQPLVVTEAEPELVTVVDKPKLLPHLANPQADTTEQSQAPVQIEAPDPAAPELSLLTVPIGYEIPPDPAQPEAQAEPVMLKALETVVPTPPPTESSSASTEASIVQTSQEALSPVISPENILQPATGSTVNLRALPELTPPSEASSLITTELSDKTQGDFRILGSTAETDMAAERMANELAEAVAETMAEMAEANLQLGVHTLEQQSAIRVSLARLQEMPQRPAEKRIAVLIQQEIIRLLSLLGYRDPAQTFRSYMQRYGESFSGELLLRLFELLGQGRSFEQAVGLAIPSQIAAQTTGSRIGALILKLYSFSAHLLRPVITFPQGA